MRDGVVQRGVAGGVPVKSGWPARARLVSLALCALGAGTVWLGGTGPAGGGTRAVSLVVLAGVGALLAARGLWRRVVAVVVLLAGLGLVAAGTAIAASGGGAIVIGGLVALFTAPTWPAMGRRYERGSAAPAGTTDLWTAQDRGEDPTAR